ncbi:phosphoglycerol transferase MdoB-like AlkP superfamily enzyme [Paenibacillus taihuensis]|uniref:Phosphoglycerol transferase MdoB-like AlkP superfamily enzyme n=1 Tax=Paenibacillus taihuensis TaxID=1156355 RepID=A0A3D9RTV8_9BACL|nr:LTA synthase family protein [Paenibacillus taihuensis]REE80152.1 phosphoglycerol transferase MdoB-like AlkP superfamily enzyme [Paenibacillus taihuensis]
MSYLPIGQRRELLALNESNKRRIPLFYIAIVVFVVKMALLRHFLFSGIDWPRLAADLSAVLVILSLVELITPAKLKAYAYGGLNLIFSLLLFSSAVYFEHFGSVPTYTALYELHQVTKIQSSVESTIKFSHYLFFADIVIALVIWIVALVLRGRSDGRRPAAVVSAAPMYRVVITVVLIASFALSARFIQLGLPIANELVEAEQEGFLNYQVSAVIKAERDDSIASEGNTDEIVKEVNDLQSTYPYKDNPQSGTPAYFGAAEGKNVIIIQMEAFQNFPIHLKLGGQEVTPVLNELAGEGLYFPHIFQQIGQGNTSDAEFMSNTSIYPTAKIAMSTGYGDRAIPSLPRLLQKFGYDTNTFHVNDVTFWDRNKLYAALDFNHYYDKPNYKNDHFNSFGASDEELYRVAVEKLSADKQPFYGQFITVSSHFPFEVPADRAKMTLPDNLKGTQLGSYLLAVNYTDYAIGMLIDKLKANGMWDDTVLVLYGDHFGLQPNDNDPDQVSKALGIKYDPKVSRFNIPLIIHVPGAKEGKVVEQVGGQLDIMPTVANMLGISLQQEKFTAFGHDLMNIDRNVFGMRYYLPTGSFFNNDILFVPGQGFDDGTAVNIKTLEPVTDISTYRKDYDYIMKLMTLSDRYVKSLPKR